MTDDLILVSTTNRVRTLTMNLPRRLNGWTAEMMEAIDEALTDAAGAEDVGVVVLTATDPYYSAGVNLSGAVRT